jgi:small-conductance mechanosensitive channel
MGRLFCRVAGVDTAERPALLCSGHGATQVVFERSNFIRAKDVGTAVSRLGEKLLYAVMLLITIFMLLASLFVALSTAAVELD